MVITGRFHVCCEAGYLALRGGGGGDDVCMHAESNRSVVLEGWGYPFSL